jgi:hypothetical protein
MSERRKNIVHMAFRVMDKDGSGYLNYEDLVDRYNVSRHPDVLAKRKTEKQVLMEFLDTFDVGGEKDGKVSLQEFENYYASISASVDNDDYFELMIRNAWHISGGEGWSANTSNRRVLVTGADGRQSVQEIKNDLGLKSDDKEGMASRLRGQGLTVDASNIGLAYGDDKTEKKVDGRGRPLTASGRLASSGRVSQAAVSNRAVAPAAVGSVPLSEFDQFGPPGPGDECGRPESLEFEADVRVGKQRDVRGVKGGQAASNVQSREAGVRNAQSAPAPSAAAVAPPGSKALLDKLKAALSVRGATGILGLARKFKQMDVSADVLVMVV